MHNIGKLKIWNASIDLCVEVYEAVANMPNDERYGLSSQIKRSAVSIPSNIAEGAGRDLKKEFKHFLAISHGSSYELLTQLQISFKLKFCKEDVFIELKTKIIEIQKMNFALQQKLITKD